MNFVRYIYVISNKNIELGAGSAIAIARFGCGKGKF
jgi:hypothetical protein